MCKTNTIGCMNYLTLSWMVNPQKPFSASVTGDSPPSAPIHSSKSLSESLAQVSKLLIVQLFRNTETLCATPRSLPTEFGTGSYTIGCNYKKVLT